MKAKVFACDTFPPTLLTWLWKIVVETSLSVSSSASCNVSLERTFNMYARHQAVMQMEVVIKESNGDLMGI